MDSSDYVKCHVCQAYEICLTCEDFGKESGMYVCKNGHIICKSCISSILLKNGKDTNFVKMVIDDLDDYFGNDEDDPPEGDAPSEICPLCMIEKKEDTHIVWTSEKTEKVKKLISDFIKKHKVSCAESVQQCDAPNIESVDLVGDIVDILNPTINYGDDDE